MADDYMLFDPSLNSSLIHTKNPVCQICARGQSKDVMLPRSPCLAHAHILEPVRSAILLHQPGLSVREATGLAAFTLR